VVAEQHKSPIAIFESKADTIAVVFCYWLHRDVKDLAQGLVNDVPPMSALPSKADIDRRGCDVPLCAKSRR
jgi:hypothetical protein